MLSFVMIIFIINLNIFIAVSEPTDRTSSKDVKSTEHCKINLKPCTVDVIGLTNLKLDKGDKGIKGSEGLHALTGLKGDTGPEGKRGAWGLPGVCESVDGGIDLDDGEHAKSHVDDPLDCKTVESSTILVRECNPFEVECKYSQTCLKKYSSEELNKANLEKLSFEHGNKPFWLSERVKDYSTDETIFNKGFDLTEFYFNNDKSRLEFLKDHTTMVTQKIKYHCKNSLVVPKNKSEEQEKALQMLSWGGHLIGSTATGVNRMSYDIEKNGCQDSSTEWNHALISLKMKSDYGLPVLDFYIRDIRSGEQKFYIELLELCFS